MRFLRKSLIGLFLMAATLALLTYAVMMVRGAIENNGDDQRRGGGGGCSVGCCACAVGGVIGIGGGVAVSRSAMTDGARCAYHRTRAMFRARSPANKRTMPSNNRLS